MWHNINETKKKVWLILALMRLVGKLIVKVSGPTVVTLAVALLVHMHVCTYVGILYQFCSEAKT